MTKPELVGILNVTPDSFSDGGRYSGIERAVEHARSLLQGGATYIDVGAESTRPGAKPLTDDEEWKRLETVLETLLQEFPGAISLDTYHACTVRRAMALGKIIINDVTSFHDPKMIELAAESGTKCIVSHMPERFGADIQLAHKVKPVESVDQVRDELLERREQMVARGVMKENIILDPGIGFGKTPAVNWELLKFGNEVPDAEVMVGYSRKRFLGDDRMNIDVNVAAGRVALRHGAKYFRVHDVAGHLPLLQNPA